LFLLQARTAQTKNAPHPTIDGHAKIAPALLVRHQEGRPATKASRSSSEGKVVTDGSRAGSLHPGWEKAEMVVERERIEVERRPIVKRTNSERGTLRKRAGSLREPFLETPLGRRGDGMHVR
jgi:hypothetical protein